MIENKKNLTRNVLLGFIFVAFVIVVLGLKAKNKEITKNDEQLGGPGVVYQVNLLPDGDGTRDLGTSTPALRWNGYFNNLTVSGTCTGCGTGSGTGGSAFSTHVTVTNGSTTSSLRSDGLYIATSTINLAGLFNVDSSGNTNISGTVKIGATTSLTNSSGGLQIRSSDATGLNVIANATTQLVGSAASLYYFESSADGAGVSFRPHTTTNGDGVVILNNPFTASNGFSASSGQQDGLEINFNTNQSGSAKWNGLYIVMSPQKGTGGTGTNYLINAFVSSTQKFTVDDAGNVMASGTIQSNSNGTAFLASNVSSTSQFNGRVLASTTLNASTGNETAFQFNYTTNKATSGNDTGLSIDFTDLSSPGTSFPFIIRRNGTATLSYKETGSDLNNQLLVPGGNLSTPGIAHSQNTDTGFMFQSSPERIRILPGQIYAMSFTNTTQDVIEINELENQDIDFVVRTTGESNTFFVDGGTSLSGFATGTPKAILSVEMDLASTTMQISQQGSSTVAFAIGSANQNGVVVINTSTNPGANQKPGIFITDGRIYHGNLAVNITANGAGITTNGELVDCGAAACVPSALKYKTSVTPYKGDVLALYRKLVEAGAISNYQLKDSKGKPNGDPRKGLIADVVEKIDPDLVGYTVDGQVNTLHFEDFTGLTVVAIDQLNTRISIQESEIALLKKKIKEIQAPVQRPLTHIYIGGGFLFLLILVSLRRKY